MPRRLTVSLPVALALAGVAPLGLWLAPQDAPRAAKIGFIELQKVFEADAALIDDLKAIKARAQQVDEEIKTMRDALEKVKMQRDVVTDRTSEQYLRLSIDLDARQNQIKQFGQGMQSLLNHEADQRNLGAYDRIRKAVAELAAERGLDAVVRVVSTEDREPEMRLKAAEMGMVLYSDPKLDVTADVIKLLKTK